MLKLQKAFYTICVFFAAANVQAHDHITPTDVYAVVDRAAIELEIISRKGILLDNAERIDLQVTERLPRHVLQKARGVFLKVQELKRLNGLPEHPVPPFPSAQEVKPAHVKQVVDIILDDVLSLKESYGLSTPVIVEKPTEQKTPTDVYERLVRIQNLLSSLGVASITPSNVYRIAVEIVADLKLMLVKSGVTPQIDVVTTYGGKAPKHVYEEVRGLLADIKSLCLKNVKYCLPGGVKVPPSKKWDIINPAQPVNVLDLMGNAAAEVKSLKSHVGIADQLTLPEHYSGKLPSDVFRQVKIARQLVSQIK